MPELKGEKLAKFNANHNVIHFANNLVCVLNELLQLGRTNEAGRQTIAEGRKFLYIAYLYWLNEPIPEFSVDLSQHLLLAKVFFQEIKIDSSDYPLWINALDNIVDQKEFDRQIAEKLLDVFNKYQALKQEEIKELLN